MLFDHVRACGATAIVSFLAEQEATECRADLNYISRMGKPQTRAGVWLSILLASSVRAFALDPSLDVSQYAHTAWKIREGFTKGTIFSMAQTPDGYLWLGTEFGLVRFDGVQAIPWQPPVGEQLPSNWINALLVARDGTLLDWHREGACQLEGCQAPTPKLTAPYFVPSELR